MQGYKYELYHHGILGQRWGKKNGPPYPLGAGDHSASERKAGWRKSLDKNGVDKKEKKGYTKNRISGSNTKEITATALRECGEYIVDKSDKLDYITNRGKSALSGGLGAISDVPVSDIGGASRYDEFTNLQALSNHLSVVNKNNIDKYGWNPDKNHPYHAYSGENCLNVVISMEARMRGKDVVASPAIDKKSGLIWNKGRDLDTIKRVFDLSKDSIIHQTVSDWNNVEKDIICKFGNGSRGILAVKWSKGGGHFVNWIAENGKVLILDGQPFFEGPPKQYGLAYPISKLNGKTSTKLLQSYLRTDTLKLDDNSLNEFVDENPFK